MELGSQFQASQLPYARGQLQGMLEAMRELSGGVSQHYEHGGEPVPERIAKHIEDTEAMVAKAEGAQDKCIFLRGRLWGFGREMGRAAWQDGYEAGQRNTETSRG
jgi:hypothetical protein